MRDLSLREIEFVSGSGEFGCVFVGVTELGGYAGGAGAIGSTAGMLVEASSAMATAGAFIGAGVAVSAIGGYNVGVAINRLAGVCSAEQKEGGS